MARFLKGDAAIEHLKAGGTLWGCGPECLDPSERRPANVWSFSKSSFYLGGGEERSYWAVGLDREVRTEPPERTYAVGDIVTGDVAYRLVELGAKVEHPRCINSGGLGLRDGKWDALWRAPDTVSHARRTLWNPDADEWRIVEPPKTITAEEARKVVAAGGVVARTFVAPESEWVEHTFRWYERIVDGDGEWVVRRAATEKVGVLTTEEEWALRRAEEGQELNRHEQRLLTKALRRLVGEMGK